MSIDLNYLKDLFINNTNIEKLTKHKDNLDKLPYSEKKFLCAELVKNLAIRELDNIAMLNVHIASLQYQSFHSTLARAINVRLAMISLCKFPYNCQLIEYIDKAHLSEFPKLLEIDEVYEMARVIATKCPDTINKISEKLNWGYKEGGCLHPLVIAIKDVQEKGTQNYQYENRYSFLFHDDDDKENKSSRNKIVKSP